MGRCAELANRPDDGYLQPRKIEGAANHEDAKAESRVPGAIARLRFRGLDCRGGNQEADIDRQRWSADGQIQDISPGTSHDPIARRTWAAAGHRFLSQSVP